jgi:hypothetical protein
MKKDVSIAIDELQSQFVGASIMSRDDGQGGAFVVMEPVSLGPRFEPSETWVGFHITAQYPYADIYPVFVGSNIIRVDGLPFQAPVTPNHKFEGRPAVQVSRRNSSAQTGLQSAKTKILKIINFLETMQ